MAVARRRSCGAGGVGDARTAYAERSPNLKARGRLPESSTRAAGAPWTATQACERLAASDLGACMGGVCRRRHDQVAAWARARGHDQH